MRAVIDIGNGNIAGNSGILFVTKRLQPRLSRPHAMISDLAENGEAMLPGEF